MKKVKNLPKKKKKTFKQFVKDQYIWWLMLLPGVLITAVFKYGSMFGIALAFQKFSFAKGGFFGHKWVGLGHFKYIFQLDGFWEAVRNTLIISGTKIVLGILVPLLLALLINEIGKKWFAKIVQTTFFLPFFLSWIILGGIINQMFSYDGIINSIVSFFGGNKVLFLLDNNIFRQIIIWSDVWKGMGYNMVIFLAAILGIDPNLYEAAKVDGASRLRQTWHITLPGIVPVVVLVSTLSLGGLLNGNFDQVYVLYNPMVYESADIIDTFIYRLGFEGNPQIDVATAVGLLKSIISVVLVGGTYYIAYKKFDYRIF